MRKRGGDSNYPIISPGGTAQSNFFAISCLRFPIGQLLISDLEMKNIYLAVVIVIAIATIAGGLVIFLMNRASETGSINPPAPQSTQTEEEATGTPESPAILRDLGATPEALP
ncbi:hypothetical protein A3D07_01240 [Candidatus Curtissbacteria bacterium RIFCSPHIGHO2_02_FULL_42_15]|uniref:Uncharacterized protein n=1 Tax=Candidatus Curtissbacteria bacterium RIFCSPHIGHO2_02_FULL_42_15 TaxID=1797716 RepID=A0A1F5GGL2_9BACT|nr:MAG: hypothetical protein A3D07_01240 [Candidatus Curtissbacteria bacterium RIFCSPHIGHO2_02_FULL_42_15]